ncbi:hypothetical protein Anapl_08903 [Anas platyrhynchos]|uniref:Uncharacterized protein n=1 Tax=Anas platyrhynchos TaxID=8839 RepID=R0K3X1_ANAPL|nr:hypothetical protein Anapl_08903 [Anas platyrhynchos]
MLKMLYSEFAPFATALCADERSCPGLKAVRNKLSLHTASLFGEGQHPAVLQQKQQQQCAPSRTFGTHWHTAPVAASSHLTLPSPTHHTGVRTSGLPELSVCASDGSGAPTSQHQQLLPGRRALLVQAARPGGLSTMKHLAWTLKKPGPTHPSRYCDTHGAALAM